MHIQKKFYEKGTYDAEKTAVQYLIILNEKVTSTNIDKKNL